MYTVINISTGQFQYTSSILCIKGMWMFNHRELSFYLGSGVQLLMIPSNTILRNNMFYTIKVINMKTGKFQFYSAVTSIESIWIFNYRELNFFLGTNNHSFMQLA